MMELKWNYLIGPASSNLRKKVIPIILVRCDNYITNLPLVRSLQNAEDDVVRTHGVARPHYV